MEANRLHLFALNTSDSAVLLTQDGERWCEPKKIFVPLTLHKSFFRIETNWLCQFAQLPEAFYESTFL
jgi:hypothetical protein